MDISIKTANKESLQLHVNETSQSNLEYRLTAYLKNIFLTVNKSKLMSVCTLDTSNTQVENSCETPEHYHVLQHIIMIGFSSKGSIVMVMIKIDIIKSGLDVFIHTKNNEKFTIQELVNIVNLTDTPILIDGWELKVLKGFNMVKLDNKNIGYFKC